MISLEYLYFSNFSRKKKSSIENKKVIRGSQKVRDF